VVKSLNHITYYQFDADRRPHGAPGRIAIAAAGDDRAAVAAVMQLIDRLGFDAVDAGPLAAGPALEPNRSVFGASYSADQLSNLLSPEASSA
jgi:predicted dinucleotide-binding enzyme